MSVLKPRSRTVTFRVSAEEFDALTSSCVDSGARSISDFARAAVMQKIHSAGVPAGTLTGDLNTLGRSLAELDQVLLELSRRIRGMLGSVPDSASGNGHEAGARVPTILS